MLMHGRRHAVPLPLGFPAGSGVKMRNSKLIPEFAARLLLSAWCVVLLTGGTLHSQTVGGTIRGQVQDLSGGFIAGARVLVLDFDKGIGYRTLSDSSGLFQVSVPVGKYEIEVSADGFASTKEVGIALSLGQTWTTDFVLPVGTVRETMEVRAEMPLLDTASGTISELVDRERLEQLPLNGRDYGFLVLLQPGVVPNHNGANPTPFGGRWSNFLVNGQIDQATLFLIDGSDVSDVFSGRTPSGSSGLLLGMDAVQEFQVLLNNYRAEFGRNSGGVVHVVTRSGSNQFHGSIFEYLRNSALDAKNFFDLPDEPIPPFRRNQFGASLGGPIRRDQTFFLVDYEGLRERKSLTSIAIVPTAAARSGAVEAVLPFLNAYPLPDERNIPAGARTAAFTSSATQRTNEDFGLARVDHRLASHSTLFARASIQDSFAAQPYPSTPVPGFPNEVIHRNIYSQLGATSAIGSNAVNQFHFAFNRTREDILVPPAPEGLATSPVPGRSVGLVEVVGLSNLGNLVFSPFGVAQNLFEVVDNYSYRRGRHSQKFGGSVQRYQANEVRGTFFSGQYRFINLDRFLAAAPATFVGVLGGTNAAGDASPAGWRWTAYNVFAQDDIALRPNLTLNLGIRYEFSTTPYEVNGLQANLRSFGDAEINVGGQLFNTIARSWAPRFGFAWSPLAGGRSVLRGGYGIFFNPLVVNLYGNSRLVPPFVDTVVIPGAAFPNPLARPGPRIPSTTGQSIEFNLSQPYAQQWNLQWQQAFSTDWVAKLAYVGNRGIHIIRSIEGNPAEPVVQQDGRKFFPPGAVRRNPKFGSIRGRTSDGLSWYNSLQLGLEKHFAEGWTFQGSYTWSKSLSTNDSSITGFPSQPSNTQDPDDIYLDKALAAFDSRHRLVFNFIYRVPSLGLTGAAAHFLDGWSFSGIGSFNSGLPVTIINGFNSSRNLQITPNPIADRPDWNPDFSGDMILNDPAQWFNPDAFRLAQPGFYGNVPRNALTGPGFANLDLSLGKSFAIQEPHQLELRADLFNLFNHPNFATPRSPTGAQVSGGVVVFPDAAGVPVESAGQIFNTVSDSRQIQFSLRYRF